MGRSEKNAKFQLLRNMPWHSFYMYIEEVYSVYAYIHKQKGLGFLYFLEVENTDNNPSLETLHQLN